MGQYYSPINLDKKQYFEDIKGSSKLMEHSYIGNNFVNVVENLLSLRGNWYKTRLVWAGDYMDKGLFIPKDKLNEIIYEYNGKESRGNEISLYLYADKFFKKIQSNKKKEYGRYIINHTKKEYVDKKNIPIFDVISINRGIRKRKIHPLPLLTCSGNNRGGGDYHGNNMEKVGSWAGDIISVENKLLDKYLNEYSEIHPDFKKTDK